jgi:carbon-monoxide dehydrogenase medium subunit
VPASPSAGVGAVRELHRHRRRAPAGVAGRCNARYIRCIAASTSADRSISTSSSLCRNPIKVRRVLLREVDYARPESVDDAVRLLGSKENARALAGGQSLVNVMKVRVASPDVVVDLNRIRELREIRSGPGGIEIGAMATYDDVIRGTPERPLLAEVARTIADVQVRNRGTIGGNVCSNDPTNHFPPLCCALGATFTIRGVGGERTVGADEFFEGVYMTAVQPGELLTKVTIPAKGDARDGWASVTLGRDGTGIVNVAACVRDGSARISIGCVAAVPVTVTVTADETAVRDAVRSANLDPPSDVHASADYRRHLAEVLSARAVANAR